jgi:RecA-family ATPase
VTAAYEIRMAMLANGYVPLPCNCETKRPVLAGWPDAKVTAELINGWDIQFPKAQNHGLRLEAFDLDISDQDVCDDLESEIRDWFDGKGQVLTRFGNPPRRLVPIRIVGELTKTSRLFHDPSGKQQGLELLGTRSQFLAYGMHPKGYNYTWAHDRGPRNVPIANLPQIPAEEATQLFRHLCEVLIERHGYVDISQANGHDRAADPGSADFDADEALAAMQPTPASVEDIQRRVVLSYLQRGIHPDDIHAKVVSATMRVADSAPELGWTREVEDAAVTSRIIKQFETACRDCDQAPPWWLPPELCERAQEILDAGHKLALGYNKHGWFIRRQGRADQDDRLKAVERGDSDALAADDETSKGAGNGNGGERSKGSNFVIKPFVPFDPARLPRRQWLYGRHYLRRTVSATTAPGGFGKSSLDMVEAIAMATCRNLLGEQPPERLRVWLHNGEDNLDEMMRRVAAICQHYRIPQDELVGWFFMTSGNEVPLRVAEGYNKLEIDKQLINRINTQIEENQIDVVTLDPLITLHGVPESDNTKMDSVIRIFAGIADAHDCAIEISHHMRKPAAGSSGDYGTADIRGASAIHDAVRSARILNRMAEKDASDLALQEHERAKYFRVDKAKGNYSPAIKAVWRQFINVELPNGDDVGVVTPWNYPGQGEATPERQEQDRTADFVFLQLIDRFALEGRGVSERPSRNYAPALFADEAEAKIAKLNKITLKAAMLRLFKAGKIKAIDEGSGGKAVHKIVRA